MAQACDIMKITLRYNGSIGGIIERSFDDIDAAVLWARQVGVYNRPMEVVVVTDVTIGTHRFHFLHLAETWLKPFKHGDYTNNVSGEIRRTITVADGWVYHVGLLDIASPSATVLKTFLTTHNMAQA